MQYDAQTGLSQNCPGKAYRRRQYQLVRQGGLSRGFEQHAASLRNGLRLQAQTRPARVTQPGRFCVSPNNFHCFQKGLIYV